MVAETIQIEGIYAKRKQEQKDNTIPPFTAAACSTIGSDGQSKGLLLGTIEDESKEDEMPSGPFGLENLPPVSSQADIYLVKKYPLARARSCLEVALGLMDETVPSRRDLVAQQSARCSLAYVCMEMKEYETAKDHCENLILAGYDMINGDGPTDDKGEKISSEPLDEAQLTLVKRLMATARIYAAEASSILGDSFSAMTFILGDKKENAIDRLAMDLSGVTIEMANKSPRAKMQLAKSQSMVRCNASAAWATMGNHPVSRQLAMSANSYSTSRDDSAARSALLYGMLREGNQGVALLTLLRSSR
jgi:hypothetical protein